MAVTTESGLHGSLAQPHLPGHYLSWGAIIAGGLCAAAISFVLLTFGSAIGLSAVSPWPNAGLSPTVALLIAALWAALAQVVGFASGGYVAGRVRNSWGSVVVAHERRFRDGMHGFIVWAVGLLVGAALVASAAGGLIRTGMQAGAALAASAAPADYAFDYLMRPATAATVPATVPPAAAGRTRGTPQPQPMIWRLPTAQELQPSIVRIFADGLQAGTLPARDRAYLAIAGLDAGGPGAGRR